MLSTQSADEMFLLAALVCLCAGAYATLTQPRATPPRMLNGIGAFFAACLVARYGSINAPTTELFVWSTRVQAVLLCVAVSLLFDWCCLCADRWESFRPVRYVSRTALVAIGLGAVFTDTVVSGAVQQPWGLEPTTGWLGLGLLLWLAANIALVMVAFLLRWHAEPEHSQAREGSLLLIVILFLGGLAVLDFLPVVGIAMPRIAWVFIPLLVVGLVAVSHRYDLAPGTSSLELDDLMRAARDAVFLVDQDGVIRHANPAAYVALGVRQRPVGRIAGMRRGALERKALLRLLAREEENMAELEARFNARIHAENRVVQLSVTASTRRALLSVRRILRGRHPCYLVRLIDLREQERSRELAQGFGLVDTLTGIASLDGLHAAAAASDANLPTNGSGEPVKPALFTGLYVVTIAGLRRFNAEHGRSTGDRLLLRVVARLKRLAEVDEVIARIDSSRFGILTQRTSAGVLRHRLAALRERLEQEHQIPVLRGADGLLASLSFEAFDDIEFESRSAIRLVQSALREVSRRRANEFVDSSSLAKSESFGSWGAGAKPALEQEVGRAIERGEFVPHYDPVIDLRTRQLAGVYASVRWRHPRLGMLRFRQYAKALAASERQNAYFDLAGDALVHDVTEFSAALGRSDFFICVRPSALLYRTSGQIDFLAGFVERLETIAHRIHLQLGQELGSEHDASGGLLRLRESGAMLWMEDFGVDTRSVERAAALPLSGVILARACYRETGRISDAVVAAHVAAARRLDLQIAVDRVDDVASLNRLSRVGIDLACGDVIGQALQASETLALLRAPGVLESRLAQLAQIGHAGEQA